MREIRTSGSEGGGAGYSTGPPYPYRVGRPPGSPYLRVSTISIRINDDVEIGDYH
jgi:hypothetical protein